MNQFHLRARTDLDASRYKCQKFLELRAESRVDLINNAIEEIRKLPDLPVEAVKFGYRAVKDVDKAVLGPGSAVTSPVLNSLVA